MPNPNENANIELKGVSYENMISQIVSLIKQTSDEYIEDRLKKIIVRYLFLIKDGIYFKLENPLYIPFENEDGKKNGINHIVTACADYAIE